MSETRTLPLQDLQTGRETTGTCLENPWRVLDGFTVGVNESPYLGTGWHERERRGTDGTPCRALGPTACFHLQVSACQSAQLTLLFTAPTPLLDRPYEADVYGDGKLLGRLAVEHDNWALRRFSLPPVEMDRSVPFEIRSRSWFVPARQNPESQDCRPIACYVAAAYVEACED
jgi:hypothetical protein